MLDRDLENHQEMKEMVRCVQLYFRHQRQQREIAQQLGISPSKVSRLLKRAYQEGIVRVHITLPVLPRLAAALIEHYGLRDAVVIPSGQPEDLKEDLGIAAARYFEKIAGDGVKVGLSCGYTLYYMIKHLREGLIKDLTIYPLSAESTLRLVDLFPNTLVGMMAAKYRPDVTAYALHAQLIGPLEELDRERQILLNRPEIRKIYGEAHEVDVAMVGIGAVGPETPGFCSIAEYYGVSPQKLKAMKVVGEINYQPFDGQGCLVREAELESLTKRVIAVSAERLRDMTRQYGKLVIAVAGGSYKSEAIGGALRGRLCNVLITDEEVARALIREGRPPHPLEEATEE
ncbi:MAG TPA: sugar-binding domain-containing protein [Alphaproteobacteria bacterium]|nr:sugar-binding domain-containing protein [Alphaproteobacteria bacterium]